MKQQSLLLVILLIGLLYSCNNKPKFEKHESGLKYFIIKGDNPNAGKLELGNLAILNLSYETETGIILFDSKSTDRRYLRTVLSPSHSGGSFEDGLLLLYEGDSAIFKINAGDFLTYSEGFKKLPKSVDYDENVIVKLKVIDILDRDEYSHILTESYHSSEDVELQILEKYLKNTNVTVEPTESGLYYIEHEKGTGKQVEENDLLHINYTVKYIDGSIIETTLGNEPYVYEYGTTQFVAGWVEGVGYMREGGTATFIVPSKLAYGADGNKKVLPYSTLIFEMEIIKIE
ncbi:FKBP-type peptidyl-prolyl cis-trans isomerase [Bacteroidales bacterium OttesenSCG-928-I21]|nr:FKBP-type peptidyl-prolyl cis-trans isomerase [Bacteroidales bacterium OttesenSCG-928-I21]